MRGRLPLLVLLSVYILTTCGVFDRVTAEVPLEFDIPINFDINTALKLAKLDQLPDTPPPGIKIDDIVVPLPSDLTSSIADREEIAQFTDKIYNVRVEKISFTLEENGFSQEVKNFILGIAKMTDQKMPSSRDRELILVSTFPAITPETKSNTILECNITEVTPETITPYNFDDNGSYRCEPSIDPSSTNQCNMIPGGRDAPSVHLKKLKFIPEILYCDPKTKTLKEGILLNIDTDKYPKKPSGNIKMKINLKLVIKVAPLE